MKLDKPDQQHKIPQVYLRKFGYLTENNHWKVSVLKDGETWTRQKSIESFMAISNIFDIKSDIPNISGIFEEINFDLENKYNKIINDLEINKSLNEETYSILINFIANLICRADYWRDWVMGILNHENKENFLKITLSHITSDEDFLNKNVEIEKETFYRILVDKRPEEIINRVLFYLFDYIIYRLKYFDVVIMQSQQDKPWYTSSNPVVLQNNFEHFEMLDKKCEIYFPLTPKYLAFLHYVDSKDKKNELRKLDNNFIHEASDEQTKIIINHIIKNPHEYLIIAGELKYKKNIQQNL